LRQNDRFAREAVELARGRASDRGRYFSIEDAEDYHNRALMEVSNAIDEYDPGRGYTLEALVRKYIGSMSSNDSRLDKTAKADGVASTVSWEEEGLPGLPAAPADLSDGVRIMLDKAIETCEAPRQRKALCLLREGCTYTQIAEEMSISPGGAIQLCKRAVGAAGKRMGRGVEGVGK
jgi:DNA-directed RNA polymerase specialized sigma24 family protein